MPDHNGVQDMCSLKALSPYEQLIGDEPCRSLFSEYKISLPKVESKRDSKSGSGTLNSKKLDVGNILSVELQKQCIIINLKSSKNFTTKVTHLVKMVLRYETSLTMSLIALKKVLNTEIVHSSGKKNHYLTCSRNLVALVFLHRFVTWICLYLNLL